MSNVWKVTTAGGRLGYILDGDHRIMHGLTTFSILSSGLEAMYIFLDYLYLLLEFDLQKTDVGELTCDDV